MKRGIMAHKPFNLYKRPATKKNTPGMLDSMMRKGTGSLAGAPGKLQNRPRKPGPTNNLKKV